MLRAQESDLDQVRKLMGEFKVRVTCKTDLTPAADQKPARRSDLWTFETGEVCPIVHYSRYLNTRPDFDGSFPALLSDMGLGFDGPMNNWYTGGVIRLFVKGVDILGARNADLVEVKDGAQGHLHLMWMLTDGGKAHIYLTAADGGMGMYAKIVVEGAADSPVRLNLTCYPGGFGPAYKAPSHRQVTTASASAEVPPGFVATATQPNPELTLATADDAIFYGDKYTDTGSLFLLMPTPRQSGRVMLSSYGVGTVLEYPAAAGPILLAFYQSDLVNATARENFLARQAAERQRLERTEFWPK